MPKRTFPWLALVILPTLSALLIFQGYAYYFRLDLSLGPRVVLQPWLMQHGYLLYEHIADEHSPLIYLLLSAAGQILPVDGLTLAKVALVILLSLSTALTFLAGKRNAGWFGGLWAAFFFVCWSFPFGSGKLWHETFLTPIYALLLFYAPPTSNRSIKSLLLLGFLGGLAILIKQHAVVVVGAFILWDAMASRQAHRSYSDILRQISLISFATILPIAMFGIYHYLQAGTLENLLFWTVGFNFVNGYSTLAAQSPDITEMGLFASAYLLVPATFFCILDLKNKGDPAWLTYGWGLILLITSSLTAYPRFGFFHLQSSLPALAWVSSLTLFHAVRHRNSNSSVPYAFAPFATGVLVGLTLFWVLIASLAYQPVSQPNQTQMISEYTDLVPLATEVREHIGSTDCFYIFPDDEATANLYYLTRCLPPRYWVLAYPWFMLEPVKNRILATLQSHPPEWLIYFPGRWDIEHRAVEVIDYIQMNYQSQTKLHWAQGDVWLLKRQP